MVRTPSATALRTRLIASLSANMPAEFATPYFNPSWAVPRTRRSFVPGMGISRRRLRESTGAARAQAQQLIDDLVLLRFGQGGIERDRYGAGVVGFGFRIFPWLEAKLAVRRLGVHRNIVNLDADAGSAQAFESRAARDARGLLVPANHVKVPSGGAVRVRPGQRQPAVGQLAAVAFGERRTPPHIVVDARHLAATERRLNVGHAVIPPELERLVRPRSIRLAVHAAGVV